MEAIGKILSITLLTVFGSAAAAVYLVDSDIMPSFLGRTPVIYTSDTKEHEKDIDSYTVSYRRKRERTNYAEVSEESDGVEKYSNVKPIWGQSYDADPASSRSGNERARRISEDASINSIIENMEYWNGRYHSEVRSGRSGSAETALRNYLDYKSALEISLSSNR
jgi:hypothetical protein